MDHFQSPVSLDFESFKGNSSSSKIIAHNYSRIFPALEETCGGVEGGYD